MKLGNTDLEDKIEKRNKEMSVVRISSEQMTKGC